jgi:hypothetical protein
MIRKTRFLPAAVVACFLFGAGCFCCPAAAQISQPAANAVRRTLDDTLNASTGAAPIEFQILARQTVEGLGACQGAAMHDGFLYLYGDLYEKDRKSGPGVIRQYKVVRPQRGVPELQYTEFEIRLTRDGENLIPHPTGLTWHPTHGLFLGNTITATKKGTIFHLDWTKMIGDRNLDHAVLNTIDDDAAVQGCRPEFVRFNNRWLLASADYGGMKNALRFYDPDLLARVKTTSEPGVLLLQYPCGPWVQQLHWVDGQRTLLLIQNQIEGKGWRVTVTRPTSPGAADLHRLPVYDSFADPAGSEQTDPAELEGFTMLDREYGIFVTSSRTNNVVVARVKVFPPERGER